MEAAFVLLRAVHTGAAVALLGGLVFATFIAPESTDHRQGEHRRRLIRHAIAWLAVTVASGAGWLGFAAVVMSGLPAERALDHETLRLVLTETQFGHAWLVRAGLGVILLALLAAVARPGRTPKVGLTLCTAVAAALLAGLAWAGHANAERGAERVVHLAADAIHLVAAGAWLGALLPLVGMLQRTRRSREPGTIVDVARVIERFSAIGVGCVGALVASGSVSAWFTVGSFDALVSTHYGHLLLAKLAVFGAMVALAAFNRARLTPLIADAAVALSARVDALQRLQRNAAAEALLGLAVLGIVGALGLTLPAAHSARTMPSMQMP